ncbi:hypothetical protein HanRHA438_Chr07g0317511 [Helianthus annuus]|nr:hypothetical protein HanRHA438_Chr07g0317511 [Helianthus annuus]
MIGRRSPMQRADLAWHGRVDYGRVGDSLILTIFFSNHTRFHFFQAEWVPGNPWPRSAPA